MSEGQATPDTPGPPPRRFLIVVLLAAVALTTAARFDNQLVWDDLLLVELAEQLTRDGDVARVWSRSLIALVQERPEDALGGELDLYRPLPLLTFTTGYAWFGRAPWPQHALNLGLHLACTVLVFLLARGRKAGAGQAAALLAAAWFGLSPHLAEAHVWISGRFDLMCAFFALAALLLARAACAHEGRARHGLELGTFAAFGAALLSKEAALFALALVPFWPEPRATPAERVRRSLPFAAAVACYLLLRGIALGASAAKLEWATLLAGAARFGAVVADAASSLLVPIAVYSRLPKEDYDALGAQGLFGCFVFAGLLALCAFRLRRELPRFAFGVAWLFALLVPVALVSAKPWPGFGRYLYLPAALFLPGCADLALHLYARARSSLARAGLRVALGLHLLVLAAALHAYTYDWHDDVTLFRSIIAAAEDRSHGYGFLGITYIERRDFARAAVLLRKAVDLAPDDRRYLGKLGHALLFSGQRDAARTLARDAIARLKDAPEFHLLEALTWIDSDPEQSARGVLECLRIDPAHAECLDALAFLRGQHPNAAAFRDAFDSLTGQPRYSAQRSLLHAAVAPAAAPQRSR